MHGILEKEKLQDHTTLAPSFLPSFDSSSTHTHTHFHMHGCGCVFVDKMCICVISYCKRTSLFSSVTQSPAELAGLRDRMSNSRGVFVFSVMMFLFKECMSQESFCQQRGEDAH